jgi:hypothetical protein
MSALDEITALTAEYYALIGKDHHKDRDCHWYINSVWSYGQPVKYRVEHYGYILDDICEDFTTYDKACLFLIEILKDAITKEEANTEIE